MVVSNLGTRLSSIPSADGALLGMLHVSDNVYLTRGQSDSLTIILSNAEEPQSDVNLRRVSLESGINYRSESEGDLEDCVVLEFDSSVDSTAAAKVAEHLCHGSPGHRNGDDLVDFCRDIPSHAGGGLKRLEQGKGSRVMGRTVLPGEDDFLL